MATVTCSICFRETSKTKAAKCDHCDVWLCRDCVDWGGWLLPICKCPHCGRKVAHANGAPLKVGVKKGVVWAFTLLGIFFWGAAKLLAFILDQIPSRKS